jgi:signal transduction histidine kinase
MRLRDLLAQKREEILHRFVARVREAPMEAGALPRLVLLDGLPAFLDHLIIALSRREDPGADMGPSSTSAAAGEHGLHRLEIGFDVAEVVREFGILRDVVLELLIEDGAGASIDLTEYRVLSRHISAGAVESVHRYVSAEKQQRDQLVAQHFAFLAHELRHKVTGALATLSWWRRSQGAAELAVKTLDDSLGELSSVLDKELVAARLEGVRSGMQLRKERIAAADLMFAAARDARSSAESRGITISTTAEPGLALDVDVKLIRSALGNLIANAVKFTRGGSTIQLRATVGEHTVIFEIEDECGGLPPGTLEQLFEPFVQLGRDRSGFGLGLSIARQAVEAHGGKLSAEDLPGRGCIFRVELPLT